MADRQAELSAEHETQLVAKLASPEWEALRSKAKARMEKEFERLAHQLMRGDEVTPDGVQYRRGFFAGIKFLLDNPTLAEEAVERELARANQGE